MAEKQPFVPPGNRPDLPSPSPDKRISELQVRELEVLLQQALLRKNLKLEIVEHKPSKFEKMEKIEKWEGSKWENLKAELGKWEHGEKLVSEVPVHGPVEDPRIDQLISVVTQLQSTVATLSREIEALRTK